MTACRRFHRLLRAANRSILSVSVLLVLIAWHRGSWGQDLPVIPPTGRHVPQLARYLDRVEIYGSVAFRQLAVFPVRVRDNAELPGNWLTMDQALTRGVLNVSEKGTQGAVPQVNAHNRSPSEYVFILAGELLAGGKQARMVRQDTALAPGQTAELSVFCVEAHRWEGTTDFWAANTLAPASLQQELRRGAEQQRVWKEVAWNNALLGAQNRTDSLAAALNADVVRGQLVEIRERLLPQIPADTVGIIVVDGERALGAEFFGRSGLAMAFLPKLLDAYAVDVLLKRSAAYRPDSARQQEAATEFLRRVQRASSYDGVTRGSGTGLRTRTGGLLGDDVRIEDAMVHYGIQIEDRITPLPPTPQASKIRPQDRE
ncbi:MAG: hypothetical protein GXY83_00840 [Rhodopirellula sp.]|nr:hypothetical protein [Rhodopirellula sp.]